jgi:hypothetical protein
MNPDTIEELACSQVFSRLFAKLDQFDYPGVARQFTREGVWHRQGAVLRGHDAIVRALQSRSSQLFVQHILHQVSCEAIVPGHIQGFAYMTVFRKESATPIIPPQPIRAADMLISWNVDFAQEDGAWLIRELRNTPLYR